MEDTQKAVTSSVVSTTRAASRLANEDLAFHRSLDSSLAKSLDRQNERLLLLSSRLLNAATAQTETARPLSLKSIEDVEGNWRAVIDVVDSLLERADTALDEFTGAFKRLSPAANSDVEKKPKKGRSVRELNAGEIEKPQLLFEHPPTNDQKGLLLPLLDARPHTQDNPAKDGQEVDEPYTHPYQAEIEAYEYPAAVYVQAEPIPYHPFDSTTATFVDTLEGAYELLEELKQAEEIAIDLEHHDHRSYIGMVSLMQISTRNKDWIVDTLKPWRRKLSMLNEVFGNPRILKVLHGAYMDVVWLQRDLGLYLVGLFDTHHASRALGYPAGSLAYLLKRFANVDAQKQYQMADWRVRPLPKELFDYARSDTHYLLYIYDNMRNELVQKSDLAKPDHEGDKIHDILVKSAETALQRYEHPVYDLEMGQGPVGWYRLLSRNPGYFTPEQFSVFRAVHKWRDDVARQQDDSTTYVMPSHQIFSIARALPVARAELLAAAQPNTQTLRLRADELISVIRAAQEAGKQGPDMMDVLCKIEKTFPKERRAVKQIVSHSVAAFLPKLADPLQPAPTTVTNGATESNLPLRSQMSAFWGQAFENSLHETGRSSIPEVQLTVPLPPLTAEIFADEDVETVPPAPSEASQPDFSTPASQDMPEPEDDDIFILKQLGAKKRKRFQPLASTTDINGVVRQEDEVAIDEEAEHALAKAERKKLKKEAKRLARRAEAEDADATADGVDAEQEPFDYAAAPSILNPPRESRDQMKARMKKEINPYAKSLDAPNGLPRKQRERAGKSMTFQS